jgi:hypothetical protein
MRSFLIACAAMIALAVGGALVLGVAQMPTGVAFSTDGARINPTWSYRKGRSAQPPPSGSEIEVECETSWYLFVDLGIAVEDDPCAESQ